MTTAGEIRKKLDAGEWTAVEAAEGLALALGDNPVEGVTPSVLDPETWLLIGELALKAGLGAAKLLGIVKAFL
jgi:hypothetical protein